MEDRRPESVRGLEYRWWDGAEWQLLRAPAPARSPVATDEDPTAPLVIVSADTHIGPRLREDLAPYCPDAYRSELDEHIAAHERHRPEDHISGPRLKQFQLHRLTEGHHDHTARIRDLDHDGVAVEVIFHGSQNLQPIPFRPVATGGIPWGPMPSPELAGVGDHMYNQWLADFCSQAPERHLGLAHLPFWDIPAAIQELTWAREAGLRGVNFPAQRLDLPQFNDPVWEPFWSAAEDLGMPLVTHIGGAHPLPPKGPEAASLMQIDGALFGRRGAHWMIFGGVFERHPGLKLVLTEMPGQFWDRYLTELDSSWLSHYEENVGKAPRPPSEYCTENVFIGASFLARFEAEAAVCDGYAGQVLWGSDYPHSEGTFVYPEDGAFQPDGSMTRRSMRHTFAGLPQHEVRRMVGLNAAEVFGLDAAALRPIAARIGAPSFEELSVPLDVVPDHPGKLAFRQWGAWA